MEKPKLEDFDLTEEKLDLYDKQRRNFYDRLDEYCKNVKSIKKSIIWISLIITAIVLAINIAAGFKDEKFAGISLSICMIWDITVVLYCFDTLESSIFDVGRNKELEIKRQYIDINLEKSVENYNKALQEYERYLEKRSVDFWNSLNGYTFEKEIAKLFKTQGYATTITPATGDGGVDIILTKGGERIAVQCKHHAKPVGPNDVRALQGVVASQNYSKGIFVSLNGYTSTVRQEVRYSNVPIELLELRDILQMAKGKQEKPLTQGKMEISKKILEKPVGEVPDLHQNLRLGNIVTHKTFGDGIIIKIDPKENNEKYLTIDFAHSIKKFVFPSAFCKGYLTFKKDIEAGVFGEYSFSNYWMFAKREYQKVLIVFPSDDKDYSHIINGLKEVMRIENFDFKTLVLNFEKIRPEYYYGGKRYEISEQKGLIGAIITFESYVTSIREKRLSIESFYDFLLKETKDNEIYLSNKLDDSESIESITKALLAGKKPIEKLIPSQIKTYIERLQYILSEEKIDISLLARYSNSADRSKFIQKYSNYNNPSTDMILEWFARFYRKTITTI